MSKADADLGGIDVFLRELLASRRMSERALAMYLGVSSNAVNAWAGGTRVPDPPYCWKIAEFAHLPVEYVMRLAGHLPPTEENAGPRLRPQERELAAMAAEMDDEGLEVLAALGHALLPRHRRPPRTAEYAERDPHELPPRRAAEPTAPYPRPGS